MSVKPSFVAILFGVLLFSPLWADPPPSPAELLRRGIFEEEVNKDFEKAANQFQEVAKLRKLDEQAAGTALFRLAEIARKRGKADEASKLYQEVITDFPNQPVLIRLAEDRIVLAGGKLPSKLQHILYGIENPSLLTRIETLLKQGADPNAPVGFDRMLFEGEDERTSNRVGTTFPLDVAVEQSDISMVKLLLAHGAKPRGGELSMGILRGGEAFGNELAELLLKAGADPNSHRSLGPAISCASYKGNKALVERLLSHPGLKVDEPDVDGITALMHAVAKGHEDIIRLLLKAGADPQLKNAVGQSAVTIAKTESDRRQKIIAELQVVPQKPTR